MSLRLRAVLIAVISLGVLWLAAVPLMMRSAHHNLDRTLDGRLAMSARMVSGLLERSALAPSSASTDLAEALRITGKEGIACEIRLLRGEVLASSANGSRSETERLPVGFSTQEVQGDLWRIYVMRANGYQVTTADRMDQRDVLINELLYAAGVPFLLAFLGGLFALWIGIGKGLAPLKALCGQLRNRNAEDTTPITVHRPPAELRPVLEALNGLLGRLAAALSREKAFTDAAAHELRTPLTVIDTHLQVIRLSEGEGEDARASLDSAEEGVKRLRRTLDQMMVLARTEAPVSEQDGCTSVQQAVESVIDQVDRSASGRVIWKMIGADAPAPISRSMLQAAVRNLIDNAIRYSPESSPVEIALDFSAQPGRCHIAVSDRGPGLSEEQMAQVGRRFWRGDQKRRRDDGAGLGLSIVRAIAERFGGALSLRARAGGGLVAEFQIPLA